MNSRLNNWKPDFERFQRAIIQKEPGPVPVGDLFADPGFMGAFLGEKDRVEVKNSRLCLSDSNLS